jgi:hypothetical protein
MTDVGTNVCHRFIGCLRGFLNSAALLKKEIARKSGIVAEHIRIANSHSMPTLRISGNGAPSRTTEQWGNPHRRTSNWRNDLASRQVVLGKERVVGASHNRTVKNTKRTNSSQRTTDDERCRVLYALYFVRELATESPRITSPPIGLLRRWRGRIFPDWWRRK